MALAASTRFESPQGSFELLRYPGRREESLQAWCAADALLLDAAQASNSAAGDTLVVNDEHGALSTALQPQAHWTDSALAAIAASANLARNHLDTVPVRWATDQPGEKLQLVVMRVPKQLPYFEYQLASLHSAMQPGATLLCGGMDKHLSPQTAQLIEKYFGPVTRHPGKRKARVFSARRGTAPARSVPATASYYSEYLDCTLISQPNVFSREALDIGSRFLIENLHQMEPGEQLADLACGNGVLGLCALRAGLGKTVSFCDESAMAIASARLNAEHQGVLQGVHFHHGDGFKGLDRKFDRVLCNPPFHLGHSVDDYAGRRLLQQCAQQLLPGGQLYVVANRHLDYGRSLNRYFSAVEQLAVNHKFIIWKAYAG